MDQIEQSLEFVNYEGVCPAEKDILQTILRGDCSKQYSKGLFCFDTPFSSDKTDCPVGLEFGQGEDCSLADSIGDISIASQSTSNQDVAEVSAQGNLNGPPERISMPLPPHQQNAIVSQAGLSHIPTFYPGQQHMTVAVSAAGGAGPSVGPNSVMFNPMSHMIQTPAGYYHPYYGPPQGGGQPHMSYVSVGEAMNPESNYTGQQHHKVHHDPHHSVQHSPNTSGQGPNSYGKGRRKQQQQPGPHYYHYHPSFYGQVPYYNQQQLQSVTGSPIIMTSPSVYLPHQHHPGMYNQGPPGGLGNEMEHHPGNLPPHQSMGPIPNEITFAQHHPGSQVFTHNSPTHSHSRYNNPPPPSNRGTSAPPPPPSSSTSSAQSDPVVVNEQRPSSEVEKTSSSSDLDVTSPPLSIVKDAAAATDVQHPNGGEHTSLKTQDNSSTTTINKTDCHNPPLPSSDKVSEVPIVNGDTGPISNVVVEIMASSNLKNSSEPSSKDTITTNKSFNKINKEEINSVQKEKVVVGQDNREEASIQLSVNGDREINSADKLSFKNRDNVSADPLNLISEVKNVQDKLKATKTEVVKSSSSSRNNSSSRSVNTPSSTSSTSKENLNKKPEEIHIVEVPLSGTTSSSDTTKPSAAAAAAHAAKGRSWASIASSKTNNNNIPTDGAAVRQGVIHHSYTNQLDDQAAGGSSAGSFNYSGNRYTDQNVPMHQGDVKDFYNDPTFDTAHLTDENDPIALRLGEHLQKYTLDHQSIPLAPRGLCNQSNYCFLNATLQALLACPTFVNMFRAMSPILGRTPSKATPIIQSVYDFVTEFSPLIRGSANKKERSREGFCVGPNLEPTGIRKCLGLLSKDTFKVEGRQEDAEEFLSHLLNGLHDEMIKVIKWCENRKERMEKGLQLQQMKPGVNPVLEVNGGASEESKEEEDDEWQVMGARNKSCLTRRTAITKSPISEAFLGQMCLSLSRINSMKKADLEPFFTLQLAIQNENVKSVRDALEAISIKEEVSGITSASGNEVEAWRQVSLEELPPVLILHLKRFVYEKNGILKINKKLEFGVDLEIGKELLSNNSKGKLTLKQRQYKLFAVVYHDGEEAHKGHYVADCFHTSGGTMWGQWGWLRYDDISVKQVAESNMLNPQSPRVPYLLYYRRQDTIVQQQSKKERS